MKYTRIKDINEYISKNIDPLKNPDEQFEVYSVPAFDTEHPEYLKGKEIGSSKQSVMKNDILLCKINPRINRVWVVTDESDMRSIASSEWIVIRTSEYNPNFLAWYFQSPVFKKLMVSEVTGIGGSLTRAQPKRVAEYPVPVIDSDTQDKVSCVLQKLDHLIKLRKKEIGAFDELIKARFGDLVNPDILII